MLTVVTVWWLLFWTAVGLCVGSFLNAVVYRLPRNRSLRSPLWSFCPYCHHRIRWYDNIPVMSFLLLGGRCRDCHGPIPTRYVVVEVLMALVVLLLLDAFFIGHVREGLTHRPIGLDAAMRVGLTDPLYYDWPILVGHVILFGCLLSMSMIDLEHYWVDVRVTNLATVAGFVLHALWTPRHGADWIRPFDSTALISLCAIAGLGLTWIVLVCQPRVDPEDFGEPAVSEPDTPVAEPRHRRDRAPLQPPLRLAAWAAVLLLAALLIALYFAESGAKLNHGPRALLPLALLFILIVAESTVSRAADREIVEAIEDERIGARRMVLTEFGLLLPALGFALLGYFALQASPDLLKILNGALHPDARATGSVFMRHWNPLMGIATAASGYIIAGGIGWFVRIVFTLAFGKEAFGSGDIHLMAAAGCIAGWPVVVLGFFLTCGLALIGWVMTLPFKRTRALPLGPWLSLSFLTVVVFYDRILSWHTVGRTIDAVGLLLFGNSQFSN